MPIILHPDSPASPARERAEVLLHQSQDRIYRRTDRIFAGLMLFQWLAGVMAAVWISPFTWIGAASQVHLHVWMAIFLGGALTAFPVFLVWRHPGQAITRYTIAVALMLSSALLIHLTGGRIETHFHIFGSLAFLAFYRDWRVLLIASVVVALDHMARGIFWPQSVFGVVTSSHWRWVEHTAWVLFEDVFLAISIRQSLQEMSEVAIRRAELEGINTDIEKKVAERTSELTAAHRKLQASEHHLRTILESEPECVKLVSEAGLVLEVNPAGVAMVGADSADQLKGCSVYDFIAPEHHAAFRDLNRAVFAGASRVLEYEVAGLGGRRCWAETHACPMRNLEGEIFAQLSVTRDISARKSASAQLERMNKELMEASRRAGMAEVATSVLHNVGNVLNSVNISCSVIAEKVGNSRVSSVAKTAGLLRHQSGNLAEFFTSDPQGVKLPEYLGKLAERLGAEQALVLEEVASLEKNVEHIKDIISVQQSYAKSPGGVRELVSMAELLDDALRMNAGAIYRHEVKVVRDYQDLPEVSVEKHKVLQILVNLLRNAKHALTDGGRPDKELRLILRRKGEDRISVTVSDNGIGIAQENLTRVFAHGFSTKKDGHGFGLHSGVLAAQEMGGSLTLQSDGPGRGAAFTLELPLAAPESPYKS